MTGSRLVFKIRKIGNSYMIAIPKTIVDMLELENAFFSFFLSEDEDNFMMLYSLCHRE